MSLHIIILLVAVAISACIIYFGIKNAEEVNRHDIPVIKFEPRKVTDNSVVPQKPKKKYKKRNNKKPTVAENTIVEKRPVGRPKISK
jgi:hypothetical protein